jgi:hypothetical protein
MECPYCGCEALALLEPKEFRNPDFIHFHDAGGFGTLNKANWQAYLCDTCTRVVILDEDEVRRIENAAKKLSRK